MSKDSAHWKTVQHSFGNVGGKELVGSFTGGSVSDLGGMPVLAGLIQKTSLIRDFCGLIPDWRTPELIKYSIAHQVTQRVALICAGYEDGIDSNLKRNDPPVRALLRKITGIPDLCSQGTISILERKINRRTCFGLGYWFIYTYAEELKAKGVKRIVLDFDGSHSQVRGNQQGGAYNGHYEMRMYRPMFVHDQYGSLVIPVLRPGNAGEQSLVLALLKRIVAWLREQIPELSITIRGDAGLNDPEIYDWCEDNDVFYIFRLKGTGPQGGLFTKSQSAAETIEKVFGKTHGKPRYLQSRITKTKLETAIRRLPKEKRKNKLEELDTRVARVFTEFMHEAGKGGKAKGNWRQERRVLNICTYTDWGCERTFFVTNINDGNCDQLVHGLYNQRGNMERWIEEMKELDCTRLSCQEFWSNQFRLFLHGLAYRLLCRLRRLLPSSIQHWSLASIRKYFLRIPVIIVEKSRQIQLLWTSLFPWMKEFHLLCRALDRLPPLRC
ncbi:MAG: IS1380 family transposase [Nitrososphaera sp.]|nr:IS1380 family transposase [Nitrososphaera sp.]